MKIGKASFTQGYVGAGFAMLSTEAECGKLLHVPVAVGAVQRIHLVTRCCHMQGRSQSQSHVVDAT